MNDPVMHNLFELTYLEKARVQSEIDKLDIQCLVSRNIEEILQYSKRISDLENQLQMLETLEVYSSSLSSQYDW